MAARRAGAGRDQAVLRLLLDRVQPRAASRVEQLGRQVQGAVRPGLGPDARGGLRPPAGSSGVVPPDAELTPRNEAFPAWDDLPEQLKAYYARQMEVYAGYSENADHNVGRVIDAIEELGELDNTLVIWIWGDNGASMEGSLTGSFNELTMQNGIPLTDEMQLQLAERYGGLDAWGGPMMDPHYSAAWAWAGNTPFQWGKQVGSHLGGTRNPMVVHWPDRITEAGGLRSQFTHVTDLAPTILDVCGIPAPDEVDGIKQEPLHGVDVRRLVHRRGRARAAHPAVLRERRQPGHVQGRLVAGDAHRAHPVGPHAGRPRAVRAGRVEPRRRSGRAVLPARRLQPGPRPGRRAPREGRGAAGAVLGRGREIVKVLPLLATLGAFFGIAPPLPEVTTFEFRGDVENVMPGMIPRIYNHSYTISADLIVPEGGAQGVIVANADHLGGFSLFVDGGRLTHTYSMMGVFVFRQQADEPLPSGEVNVRMEFAADAPKPATGGEVTLFVNDKPVGEGRMDHTVPVRFSGYAGMDIGRDNGGVVDLSYEDRKPFAFTGTIKKVVFDIKPHLTTGRRAGAAPGGAPRPRRSRSLGLSRIDTGRRSAAWHSTTKRSTS